MTVSQSASTIENVQGEDRVDPGAAGQPAGRRRLVVAPPERLQVVVPRAAAERASERPGGEQVVARLAEQPVAAVAGVGRVIARAAVDEVVAAAREDRVGVEPAVHRVVAGVVLRVARIRPGAAEAVRRHAAVNRVGAAAAGDGVVADPTDRE